ETVDRSGETAADPARARAGRNADEARPDAGEAQRLRLRRGGWRRRDRRRPAAAAGQKHDERKDGRLTLEGVTGQTRRAPGAGPTTQSLEHAWIGVRISRTTAGAASGSEQALRAMAPTYRPPEISWYPNLYFAADVRIARRFGIGYFFGGADSLAWSAPLQID